MNTHLAMTPWLENKPEYWNMLQHGREAAKRYNISRERMDEYAVQAAKACAPQEAGKFKDEIAPIR